MKTVSFKVFIVLLVITAISAAYLSLLANKSYPQRLESQSVDPKEWAKDNHCPYEGLECPNAQEIYHRDSLAYADAEYVIDSLINANDSLVTSNQLLRRVIADCTISEHN